MGLSTIIEAMEIEVVHRICSQFPNLKGYDLAELLGMFEKDGVFVWVEEDVTGVKRFTFEIVPDAELKIKARLPKSS